MRALAQLVAHRRRVGGDTVRLTNRLTSTLKGDVLIQLIPRYN
jgi:hypothetical protein